MGLIFSLFDVASAAFGIPQYVQYILHGLTSVLLCVPSSLLTVKGVNLAVVHDAWLPFVMEIISIFCSGYFDCRGAVRTVLDS